MSMVVPWNYITKDVVVPEAILDVKEWFKTESMTVDLGDWIGRPGNRHLMNQQAIGWFLGQGWVIKAVSDLGSGGNWNSITSSDNKTKSSQIVNANNDTKGSHNTGSNTTSDWAGTRSGTWGGTDGANKVSSSNKSDTQVTSKTESQGVPYWYASSRYWLERRKLLGENVLQDMIRQFTTAYNEGREINNQRYIDLLSLYNVIATTTQEDVVSLKDQFDDYRPLVEQIVEQMRKDLDQFEERTDGILDGYGDGLRASINLRFDNELAKARNEMITRGLYNTTLWEGVSAGIAKNRELALAEISDKTVDSEIRLRGTIISIRKDITDQLHRSYTLMWENANRNILTPVDMRNTVLKWMADFVERRTDEYPDLGQIVNITTGLGYGQAGFSGT